MRQDRLGFRIADAIRQVRDRLETVDGDLVPGGDLGGKAQPPQPVERPMPERNDFRQHASVIRHCEESLRRSNPDLACGLWIASLTLAMTAENSRPGARLLRLCLVTVDRGLLLHRQPDVV